MSDNVSGAELTLYALMEHLDRLVWSLRAYCGNLCCYAADGRKVCDTKPFLTFLTNLDPSS